MNLIILPTARQRAAIWAPKTKKCINYLCAHIQNPHEQVGAILVIRHQYTDKTSLMIYNLIISRNGTGLLQVFFMLNWFELQKLKYTALWGST